MRGISPLSRERARILAAWLLSAVLALYAPLTFSTAASAEFCEAVLENNYDEEFVLPTNRVINQGETGLCWLFSTVSMLEAEALRQGHNIVLSRGYVLRAYLIDYVRMLFNGQIGQRDFEEGGYPQEALRLVYEYGIIADEAWQPEIDIQYAPVGQWIGVLKRYVSRLHKKGVDPHTAQRLLTEKVNDWLGTPPRHVEWKRTNFTPLQYYRAVVRPARHSALLFASHALRMSPLTNEAARETLWRTSSDLWQEIEDRLDSGHTPILSYRDPHSLTHSDLGIIHRLPGQRYPHKTNASHAALVVGYRTDQNGEVMALKIQQSWSPKTGQNGFFWMSREFFERYAEEILSF